MKKILILLALLVVIYNSQAQLKTGYGFPSGKPRNVGDEYYDLSHAHWYKSFNTNTYTRVYYGDTNGLTNVFVVNTTFSDYLRFIGSGDGYIELQGTDGTNIMTSTNFSVRSLRLLDFTNHNRLLVQSSTGDVESSPVKVTGSEPDSLVTFQLLTNLVPLVQTTGGTNLLRAMNPGVTNSHLAPLVLDFSNTNIGWLNWDMTMTNHNVSLLLTNPLAGSVKIVRLTGTTNELKPSNYVVTVNAQAGLELEWPITGGTNLTVNSNTVNLYEFKCWNTNLVTVSYNQLNLAYKGRGHEPAGSSTLLNGLAAYWRLDEVSGTRNDLVGGAHLIETGTVASVTGKLTNAAAINTLSPYSFLSCADSAAVQFGNTDFTVSVWIYPTNVVGASQGIISKGFKSASTNEFYLYLDDGDIVASVYTPTLMRLYGPTLSTNTWTHVVAWYVASTTTLYMRVNDTTTYFRNVGASIASTTTGRFYVGTSAYGAMSSYNFPGYIDELGKWNRVLTSEEITRLYNSGNAITYPFDVP